MKRSLSAVGLCFVLMLGLSREAGAFDETQLQELQLLGENCPSCDLSGAKLNREDLSKKNLTEADLTQAYLCLLYTSPSPRDVEESRMPSSA